VAGCGHSGNLAFDKRLFKASDAGQLAYAGYSRHRTLLQAIDFNVASNDAAAKQTRQLEIGHKMESEAEPIAVHAPLFATIGERDALHAATAFRLYDPRACAVLRGHCLEPIAGALGKLGGMRKQRESESSELRNGGLLRRS
jgi:hypothetical protein